jgi:CheY-like chemotaxis protein
MRKPKALILCIIDDDFGLDTRKELLQDNGYEVLTAQSRQKGMGLFVAHPIDAVVLDKRMNGDRVARQMKRIKPEIPILMVSACRLSTKELSYVDAFLCKGESWSALVSTVDRLLNSRFPFLFVGWRIGNISRARLNSPGVVNQDTDPPGFPTLSGAIPGYSTGPCCAHTIASVSPSLRKSPWFSPSFWACSLNSEAVAGVDRAGSPLAQLGFPRFRAMRRRERS